MATASSSSAMPSGILKRELDRQYSYEHTVLGRYRLEPSAVEQKAEENAGPALLAAVGSEQATAEDQQHGDSQQLSIQSAGTKKSVRFQQELLEELGTPVSATTVGGKEGPFGEVIEKRRATSNPLQMLADMGLKLVSKVRKAFSWKGIRLMLIDWLFLAILGIGMALMSMFMDSIIEYLQTFQLVLMSVAGSTGNTVLDYLCTYLAWLGYTELLVISSAIFVHYVAPQAVGSGIPEMKTLLRGVILKDYLAARTLLSKIVGLTFALGSGIPIGKMGPFVHVAANTANLLSNVAARFEGAYGNECRKSEMLAAACATGVACCFSAPIGGVLFSIEVTTMYFSVRNYWRGFFAAACGATVFRLLRVVAFKSEVTLVAFYQTHFPQDAFEPEELPFFALIGLLCGFLGGGFIIFYRNVVMFVRQNTFAKKYIQKNWLLYPAVIAFLVATITYPRGFGRFLSGRYKFTRTVLDFFSNCTWTKGLRHPIYAPHGCSSELLGSWTNHEGYGPYNVFLVLTLFTLTFFVLSALCNTMPIPCGMFMPMFVVGAAFGRLMGELIATIFPDGIPGGTDQPIFPGIYAVVGAAALTGAITHSVSVAMICCEITGQLIYIIPLMIAVIIANAVCAFIQPSVYDVIIGIKHLPYLPDIPPSNADVHLVMAEHIMQSNVRYLCRFTQLKEIRTLIVEMPKLRSFPVVEDPTSVMLLGSISRRTMLELLNSRIGDDARKKEAERRIRFAIDTIDKHFRESQMDDSDGNAAPTDESLGSNQKLAEPRRTSLEPPSSLEADGRRRVRSHGASSSDLVAKLRKVSREELKPTTPNNKAKQRGLSRCAYSETSIAQRNGAGGSVKETKTGRRKKSREGRSNNQVFPVTFNGGGGGSMEEMRDADGEGGRRESRFLVEPVISPRKRSAAAQASGRRPARRNAIALTQGKMSDGEESSEASTPPKKVSCPDLKLPHGYSQWTQLDHQTSLSRNITEYVRSAKKRLRMIQRHRESEERVEYDLHDDERREWELAQLEETIEIDEKLIDPAPFQLVRKTSVYKVHSLFSLLDLNRAYVTDRGRLVGVVALRDLRIAIQNSQSGALSLRNSNSSSSSGDSAPTTTESTSSGGGGAEAVSAAGGREQLPPLSADLVDLESGGGNSQSATKLPTISISDESEGDTQPVRPSALQMIQEDDEPKSHNSSLRRRGDRKRLLSTTDSAYQLASPTTAGEQSSSPIIESKDVAKAVAYLRRKSVAVEDLKALEEIPCPPESGEPQQNDGYKSEEEEKK